MKLFEHFNIRLDSVSNLEIERFMDILRTLDLQQNNRTSYLNATKLYLKNNNL